MSVLAPLAAPFGAATVRVALLGCGNIGSALAAELQRRATAAPGHELSICSVLVRDAHKHRHLRRAVTSVEDVLRSKPDIVVECMGGVTAPAHACERALRAGIHVVSANKSMVAACLPALRAAARAGGAQLRFDAAVCAGVPVLDAVARLRPAHIVQLQGVVNGTCNFILDAMAKRSVDFHEAVQQAIAHGYAEPDPSADLGGQDSAEKLRLLAEAAGLGVLPAEAVHTQGLYGIDRASLHDIRALGHDVRLLASVQRGPADIHATVRPTIVRAASPFAAAAGTHNVVHVETELAGTVALSGPGAGARPTVAALLADILACAATGGIHAKDPTPHEPTTCRRDQPSPWLLRIVTPAAPVPSPQQLAAAVTRHGAQLAGAAFLPGRALLQVHASSSATQRITASLHREATVQRFAMSPDVALRF
jgi:homoserine dehydrogenase